MKISNKERAVRMRKQGKTYNEILDEIPVAKSTLSLWLRSVGLSTPQQQRITELRRTAQRKGAEARRKARELDVEKHRASAFKDIGRLTGREVLLVGTALYWAEGSKQSVRYPSSSLVFSNMDYKMISVYLAWLVTLGITSSDVTITLYLHNSRISEQERHVRWWSKMLGIPASRIKDVYAKKGNAVTKRSNVSDLYHGIIRIRVKSSTSLNRKVQGWCEGIYQSAQF